MRLAAPRLAVEHEVLGAVSLREPHLREVVAVERFHLREGRLAEQPFPLALDPHLLLHPDELAGGLGLAGRGLAREPLAGLVGEVHRAGQRLERLHAPLRLRGHGHAASFPNAASYTPKSTGSS